MNGNRENIYLTFRLSGILFGLRVSDVEAVFNTEKITRVPGCVESVKGLLNFRGKLVPVVNIRNYFNSLKKNLITNIFRTIIIRCRGELVAVLIDELLDLEKFSEIKRADDNNSILSNKFIEGIGDNGQTFVLLDINTIIQSLTETQITG